MSKKREYNMPVGRLSRVEDFLPSPDKLAMPKDTVKVTLNLRKTSVDFFKQAAVRHHTKYQQMIRELVDRYVSHYG